jgi:hypothetical protein
MKKVIAKEESNKDKVNKVNSELMSLTLLAESQRRIPEKHTIEEILYTLGRQLLATV